MSNNPFQNLPQDWETKTLGEACEITMGQSPKGEQVFSRNKISVCHSDLECNERGESHIADSHRDISHFSNAQYDNVDSYYSESPLCHSERSEESKSHFANAQYDKEDNLPQGWEMKILGDILSSDKYAIKRGPFGSMLKKDFFVDSGIRVFEQYNPINQDSNWKRYFVTQQKFKELESFKAGAGDLLISCSGTLGKILELPKGVEVGIINQALLKLRLDDKQILNSYFVYLFNSPYMQNIILENTIGSAIQNIASVKTLKQIQIPLPPLETQQKIVAKLESEFAKIESAKSHLKKVKETIPRLKNSLLKSAFNGELTRSYNDKKGAPYHHCEDSSESEAIYNAESPLKDSIAESKAYKIVDCHELRCNSRNDESIQTPNLGGATLVAQNLQNGTNPPDCHLGHSEETHKESACHSEGDKPEESHIADSHRDISHFSNAQYDNVDSCPSDLECNEREKSQRHLANTQYEKDSNLPQDWEVKNLWEVVKINPKNKLDDDLEVSFIPMNLIADKYQNKFSYTIKTWKEVKKGYTHLQNNCIAIAKITPCFENGKCVILQDLKNGYGAGTTELIVMLPNENIVLLKFVFYFFNTAKFTKEGVKNFKGTAGQLRVSSDFISNLQIPLPPIEIQKQIVEILDSKFATLENLEKETNASLEKLQKLKSSLLNLAFKGELIC